MRLAVVTPFLDRRHGTERCLVEQVERFVQIPDCEVHIYAESIEDMDFCRYAESPSCSSSSRRAIWHRVPGIRGPHLLKFIWWYFANQGLRRYERIFHSLRFDLVFSAGINCGDADAIIAHVNFHQFFEQLRAELRLRGAPFRRWLLLLHRYLYYRLIMLLERRTYPNPQVALGVISKLSAQQMQSHFGRRDVAVIPYGVDLKYFSVAERLRRRDEVRRSLGIADSEFVVLLVGNDWKSKGLRCLLQAVAALPAYPFRVLVAGRDDRTAFLTEIQSLNLGGRVQFAEPSADVMKFYAAADAYASPSLQDSWALPPLESMACGLPVITSSQNGGSQCITEGCDGFVLQDPKDGAALSSILRRLYEDCGLRRSIGENAARTAQTLTWERNAAQAWEFLKEAHRKRAQAAWQPSETANPS